MNQQIQVGQTISTPNGEEEYFIKSYLGHGTSGIVFLVELRSTDNQQQFSQLAMKVRNSIESNEMEIIKMLMINQCSNLLNIRKYWKSNDKVFIIMDLAADGNLYEFMEKNKNTLSPQAIQDIFIQLCLGVQQLHRLNIIHRDLKPENILLQLSPLTQKFIFKICDYGLSKKTFIANTKNIGTIYYMAPELLKNTGGYTKYIDIWALGCIWYSLVNNNEDLFTGQSQPDIQQSLQNTTQPKIDIAIQKLNLNDWEKYIMKSMISIESNKRPTIDEILRKINQNKVFIDQSQKNQNQQRSSVIFNQPNTVKIPTQIPQNQQIIPNIQPNIQQNQSNIIKPIPQIIQNQFIPSTQLNIQPSNIVKPIPQIPQIQQIIPNQQSNQPNSIKINSQITQYQPKQSILNNNQSDDIEKLLNYFKKDLQSEIKQYFKFIYSLVKQQVQRLDQQIQNFHKEIQQTKNSIEQTQNISQSIGQQDIMYQNLQCLRIEKLEHQIITFQNQIKLMINNIEKLKIHPQSLLDKQIKQLQQSNYNEFDQQIKKFEEQQKQLTNTIEETRSTLEQNFSKEKQQLKVQIEQVIESYKSQVRKYEEIIKITNQNQNTNTNCQSTISEDIKQLKQSIEHILKSEEQQQEQIKSNTNSIQSTNAYLQNSLDSNSLQLKQQSKSILQSEQNIKGLQEQVNQLTITIEKQSNHQKQNSEKVTQELKTQLEEIQKSHQSIGKLENEMQLLVTNNVKQSTTDFQTNLDSQITQLQQQSEVMSKLDLQIVKLQQDMQELANRIDQTKNDFTQFHNQNTFQQQKQDVTIRKLQYDIKQLTNTNQIQQINEDKTQLQQQIKQVQEFEQQIRNIQQEMKSCTKNIEKKIIDQYQDLESNIKQQLDLQIKELPNTIGNTIQRNEEIQLQRKQIEQIEGKLVNLTQKCDDNVFQLNAQSIKIQESNQQTQRLQEQQNQFTNTVEITKRLGGEIQLQQQQYNLIQKADQQIVNQGREMKLIANSIEETKNYLQRYIDSTTLQLQQQSDKMLLLENKQLKELQELIIQLPNTLENKTIQLISKQDDEILSLKQQVTEILRQENQMKMPCEQFEFTDNFNQSEIHYQKIQQFEYESDQRSNCDRQNQLIQSEIGQTTNQQLICKEIEQFNKVIEKMFDSDSKNIKTNLNKIKSSAYQGSAVKSMEDEMKSIQTTLSSSLSIQKQEIQKLISKLKILNDQSINPDIQMEDWIKPIQSSFQNYYTNLQKIVYDKIQAFRDQIDKTKNKISNDYIKQFEAGIKLIYEILEKNNTNLKQIVENESKQSISQVEKIDITQNGQGVNDQSQKSQKMNNLKSDQYKKIAKGNESGVQQIKYF